MGLKSVHIVGPLVYAYRVHMDKSTVRSALFVGIHSRMFMNIQILGECKQLWRGSEHPLEVRGAELPLPLEGPGRPAL